VRDRAGYGARLSDMKEKKPQKKEEPVPGFDDLVKKLLNTPPSPKKGEDKKDVRREGKSNQ